MHAGKTIQIYSPSGDPRGVRIAEITTRFVQDAACVHRRGGGLHGPVQAAQQVEGLLERGRGDRVADGEQRQWVDRVEERAGADTG